MMSADARNWPMVTIDRGHLYAALATNSRAWHLPMFPILCRDNKSFHGEFEVSLLFYAGNDLWVILHRACHHGKSEKHGLERGLVKA